MQFAPRLRHSSADAEAASRRPSTTRRSCIVLAAAVLGPSPQPSDGGINVVHMLAAAGCWWFITVGSPMMGGLIKVKPSIDWENVAVLVVVGPINRNVFFVALSSTDD